MLARPKKKEMTIEQQVAISSASAKQTGSVSSPKTYDPAYPLFEIPVNQKVLVYIPKHNPYYLDAAGQPVLDKDGQPIPRTYVDKFAAHQVRIGKAYSTVRCSGGIVDPANNLDGSCPLCDASQKCWDLYNIQYEELCRSRGLAVDSVEAQEQLKDKRKELIQNMVIHKPDITYTFPIVVIETEDGTMKPKIQEDGTIKGTPCFYSAKEMTYEDKWGKPWEAMIDNGQAELGTEPNGWWAVLNFTYTPSSGEPNKRDSARALAVSYAKKEGFEQWEAYFDELTKDWDAQKAREVLVANSFRDMDEMQAAADEIIKPVLDQLRMHDAQAVNGSATAIGGSVTNAEKALEDFGVASAEPVAPAATPSAPPVAPPTAGALPTTPPVIPSVADSNVG